jgi:hypothetical protein
MMFVLLASVEVTLTPDYWHAFAEFGRGVARQDQFTEQAMQPQDSIELPTPQDPSIRRIANGGLVCGIVGLVLVFILFTFPIGLVVSFVGFVLGILAFRNDRMVSDRSTGKAKAAIILGGLGIVLSIAWVAWWAIGFPD